MGETRGRETKPERTAAELQAAAIAFDQELERQARVHADAALLREQSGITMQQLLAELATLEARRNVLAEEVGKLEAAKAKG